LPLNLISAAVNKSVAILATMASRPRSVVLVDEIENGIYYRHQAALWRSVLLFAREYESQLILTTHSEEWLEARVEAAGDAAEDIALWRMERADGVPVLEQLTGRAFKAGMETGGEIR
jgi:AAA15 family ATPase/GTPase